MLNEEFNVLYCPDARGQISAKVGVALGEEHPRPCLLLIVLLAVLENNNGGVSLRWRRKSKERTLVTKVKLKNLEGPH